MVRQSHCKEKFAGIHLTLYLLHLLLYVFVEMKGSDILKHLYCVTDLLIINSQDELCNL